MAEVPQAVVKPKPVSQQEIRAVLNVGSLLAEASAETGLKDFGNAIFMEALERYLQSLLVDEKLSPMGLINKKAFFHRLLVNQLRFAQDLKRHPEIFDEKIVKPVVIVALPRTGSSKLHRMMSRHPAVQRLSFWRILNPAPFPDARPGEPDPRIALAAEFERLVAQHFPDLMAAHPWQVGEPDEESLLQEVTFQGLGMASRARVPSYTAWILQQPLRDSYQYMRRLFQYLQWQDGGARGRPWIMKAPAHLGNLPTLLETFPDATIVHCVRDVNVSMASFGRLIEAIRGLVSDDIDLADLGHELLGVWSAEAVKHVAQRKQLPAHVPILDVQYADIKENPLAVIRKVYRLRGEELTPEAEQQIAQWEKDFPQYRFGKLDTSLERYGLTKEKVETAFAPYIDYFKIAPDPVR